MYLRQKRDLSCFFSGGDMGFCYLMRDFCFLFNWSIQMGFFTTLENYTFSYAFLRSTEDFKTKKTSWNPKNLEIIILRTNKKIQNLWYRPFFLENTLKNILNVMFFLLQWAPLSGDFMSYSQARLVEITDWPKRCSVPVFSFLWHTRKRAWEIHA